MKEIYSRALNGLIIIYLNIYNTISFIVKVKVPLGYIPN